MSRTAQNRPADDLDRPVAVKSPIRALSRIFGNGLTFSGRASRSEYWWAQLGIILLYVLPIALSFGGAAVG